MRKGIVILILLAVTGYAAYWSAGHHILRTEQGFAVLEKRFMTFEDTFVDVRGWTQDDFDAHPELEQVLKKQGYVDLLAEGKESIKEKEKAGEESRNTDKQQRVKQESSKTQVKEPTQI